MFPVPVLTIGIGTLPDAALDDEAGERMAHELCQQQWRPQDLIKMTMQVALLSAGWLRQG